MHYILRVLAAGDIRTVCHHRLNLLEQVILFRPFSFNRVHLLHRYPLCSLLSLVTVMSRQLSLFMESCGLSMLTCILYLYFLAPGIEKTKILQVWLLVYYLRARSLELDVSDKQDSVLLC
jgi:hypothetical protein